MKKDSLVYKLIGTFTGILAVILISLAIVLSLWFKNYFFNQKKAELDKQSSLISNSIISYLKIKEDSKVTGLQNSIDFVSNTMDVDILVTDNVGYIYAVSNKENEADKFTSIGISEADMNKLKQGKYVEHGGITKNKVASHSYLKPVFQNDYFCGIIVMITPVENIKSGLINVYRIVWISAFGAVAISAIIIYYFTKRIIVDPLNEINIAAKKLSKGEVERRVAIKSNDEIGELASSFNVMAESLEKVDRNRRDFISNVSHELRSPITSIKGFVAGILDGVIPKDKENYYLNIAYDEIKRLSRLVNDLLDISAMGEGKFKLNMIEFDINILIKLCLENLDGKIRNKSLDIEVFLGNDHQFVYGDRDRLIQVITNLIDNAIKYNVNSGKIKIKTREKGGKVYISIFNTGSQLKEDELIKVWDRFYKSDKSRTNKESTGLGLPIVRLILTQHGQDIWVKNEKDGVRFTFTLSKV